MLRRLLPSASLLTPPLQQQPVVFAASASCAGLLATTQPLLGNKGGTPKRKKSPYKIRRKAYGLHFKQAFLTTTDWYFCPLCSEPKKEGEWCRREDCRQIKP